MKFVYIRKIKVCVYTHTHTHTHTGCTRTKGHSIGHSKQKSVYVHVSYSEQFLRSSYFTVQEFGFGAQQCPSLLPYCATTWSMWIGMKCQLAVVNVDRDIIGVLCKMPHIFTNAEYADILYVYGFCHGSVTAAVEEYRWRFTMRRIPNRTVFSKVFNTLGECGTLPSVHVSSEWARQQHVNEQENILEMVQRSHITCTSTRRHIYRTELIDWNER